MNNQHIGMKCKGIFEEKEVKRDDKKMTELCIEYHLLIENMF